MLTKETEFCAIDDGASCDAFKYWGEKTFSLLFLIFSAALMTKLT